MPVHLHTASAADKSNLLVTPKRELTHPVRPSLHLAHDLTGLAQALYHLDAFLPSPNRVVAFLQQVVELIGAIHVFKQLALHFFFGMSVLILVTGEIIDKRP